MNRYVVVSGIPGSGKSTLAGTIAGLLPLPVLDKDDFLEALLSARADSDPRGRTELSREADLSLQSAAESSTGAVLVSWWRHPRSTGDTGTSTEWVATLPGAIVEVYCSCEPAIAAKRFLERKRHPGHLDGRWSLPELVQSFSKHASLGPLRLGPVVEVRTESRPNPGAVARAVEDIFRRSL